MVDAQRYRGPNLFYTDAGTGRNLMLLHAWTGDSHDWSWQLPALEGRYRVVAVDLRGHGRSEVLPEGNYALSAYVADIETLIATTFSGEPYALIGHSLGAQIAALVAQKHPQSVAGMISIDGSLGIAAALGPVFENVADDLASGDPKVIVPAMLDQFYDAATPLALRRWHVRRVQGMPPHVVRESFAEQFIGPDQIGVGERSEHFCRSLTVPVYHLCRDPEQAARMRPWFSHAASKVELWEGAGHWIMQDRAGDVNAAIAAWIDNL